MWIGIWFWPFSREGSSSCEKIWYHNTLRCHCCCKVTSCYSLNFFYFFLPSRNWPFFPSIFPSSISIQNHAYISCSNIALTRFDEMENGCDVFDEWGTVVGKSHLAGRDGVTKTALSRCILVPMACLLLPPVGQLALIRVGLMPASRKLAQVTYTSFLTYIDLSLTACFEFSWSK